MGRGTGVNATTLSWNQELKMPGLKIPNFNNPTPAPRLDMKEPSPRLDIMEPSPRLDIMEPAPRFDMKEHLSKLSSDSLPKIPIVKMPIVKMPEDDISLNIKENKVRIVRRKKGNLHGLKEAKLDGLMNNIIYNKLLK
tara:strand:+ start:976 stop:1389 length:414 start_codon:yes stop_codon:yes gene_type:complete